VLPQTTLMQPVVSPALELVGMADPLAQKGCRVIEFPRVTDPRGNLTFIESDQHVDFPIARVFYLYDVPGGAERGGHALKNVTQVLIAMSGSFDVILDDGTFRQRIHLNRSYFGLYIPPMMWRQMDNFSSGSVCMVLASERYSEDAYYRSWDEYHKAATRAIG
jgi:WxcM-like, C-terminal